MTVNSITSSLPYQAPTAQAQALLPQQQQQQIQGLPGQAADASPDENDTAVKAAAGSDVGKTVDITA